MIRNRGLVSEKENGKKPQQHQVTRKGNQPFKSSRKCLCKDKSCLLEYSAQLEGFFRKVVREETEQAILRYLNPIERSLPSEAEPSGSRKYKLQYEGKLPDPLFTGNRVETGGDSSLRVVLLDAQSGHLITDSPLSSMKVEILVLQGHFNPDQLEDWTQEEFNVNIVSARDGKRPLLVGDRVIPLCNGVGFINDVCFTDNSSWVRSKMFRLGAKVFEQKFVKEDQVREAVSSPFKVKDRRGETYQKRNTLSLEDEVWRLRGIAKDGKICERLAGYQIYKVEDFIQQYHIDQAFLRSILGVSPKTWEAMVQQATSCFSSNVYANPSLNLQHFCFSAVSPDEQEIQMSYNRDMEQLTHQLDQPMALNTQTVQGLPPLVSNEALMADLFTEFSDDGHTAPLHAQKKFNVRTSNWLPPISGC